MYKRGDQVQLCTGGTIERYIKLEILKNSDTNWPSFFPSCHCVMGRHPCAYSGMLHIQWGKSLSGGLCSTKPAPSLVTLPTLREVEHLLEALLHVIAGFNTSLYARGSCESRAVEQGLFVHLLLALLARDVARSLVLPLLKGCLLWCIGKSISFF